MSLQTHSKPGTLIILTVSLVSCFRQPDLSNIKCTNKGCPPGLVCTTAGGGRCVHPSDSGLSADVSASAAIDAVVAGSDTGQAEARPFDGPVTDTMDVAGETSWARGDTDGIVDSDAVGSGGAVGSDGPIGDSSTDAPLLSGGGGTPQGGSAGTGGLTGSGGSRANPDGNGEAARDGATDVSIGPGGGTSSGGISAGGVTGTGGYGSGGANATGGAATGGSVGTGGSGTGGNGTGGATTHCGTADTISDFEEGPGVPVVLPGTGVTGSWAMLHDTGAGSQTMVVESTGDSVDCHKYALHTTGSGWTSYVAFGLTNLAGTSSAPAVYPNSKNYTGIRFRAKVGAGHPSNSPVRLNISTPWTEGRDTGGSCAGRTNATPEKSAVDCYQHLGRFLQDDYALTTEWKEIGLCFGRDLYPLSLPTNLTNAQRDSVAANMLKIQFHFNQAKDWTVTPYPPDGKFTAISSAAPFDFWIDEVSFFDGPCPASSTFQSTGGAANPFPQNAAPLGGACAIASNAGNYNGTISQIYARWTRNFVRTDGSGLKVICPEQENGVTTSESMGYGMLIAAAMGDKDSFDKMWDYVKNHMRGGLMTWKAGGSGSATDGDADIAYALYMAAGQWPSGSYKTDADAMGTAFAADVADDVVVGGSSYKTVFNPSYFAPAACRKFPGGYPATVSKTYGLINANVSASTTGIPTDWGDPSTGAPKTAVEVGAQVFMGLDGQVLGYDAARVALRLGLDACTGGSDASASLNKIISFFSTKYDNGDTIDFMKAGWVKGSGQPHQKSVDCQGSFIGPMGVAGMAVGGSTGIKFRDRAFRAMLDVLDCGDFNQAYFSSTVGFLSLLVMSGNFPTP